MENFINSLTPDQRRELLSILSKDSEPTKVAEDYSEELDDGVVTSDFKVVNRQKQEREDRRVRGGKNRWVDDGSNFGDERDLETPDYTPTPRQRPKPRKQKVECHVCGKMFSVDPRLVYGEYHRCNKCVGG